MSTCGNENLPTIHKRTYKPMLKDTKYVKARMGDKSERELTVDQMGREKIFHCHFLLFFGQVKHQSSKREQVKEALIGARSLKSSFEAEHALISQFP